ncbi:hypothetical protein QPK87_02180 [Kamptonema cortianum]|nr:hypothetical protein [Kamptonema cortianum]
MAIQAGELAKVSANGGHLWRAHHDLDMETLEVCAGDRLQRRQYNEGASDQAAFTSLHEDDFPVGGRNGLKCPDKIRIETSKCRKISQHLALEAPLHRLTQVSPAIRHQESASGQEAPDQRGMFRRMGGILAEKLNVRTPAEVNPAEGGTVRQPGCTQNRITVVLHLQ